MKRPTAWPIATAAVLAAVLMLPAAQAATIEGEVSVQRVSYTGGLKADGDLAALFLMARAERPLSASIEISAAEATGVFFDAARQEAVEVTWASLGQVGPVTVPDIRDGYVGRVPGERTEIPFSSTDATFWVGAADHQPTFEMHVIPKEGAKLHITSSEAGELEAWKGFTMRSGSIAPGVAADDGGVDVPNPLAHGAPEEHEFSVVEGTRLYNHHTATGTHVLGTLTGDFTVELTGTYLHAFGPSLPAGYDTNATSSPSHSSLPESTEPVAREAHHRLFRADLKGAQIMFAIDIPEPENAVASQVEWLTVASKLRPDAGLHLHGATGQVSVDGDIVDLDNEFYSVSGGSVVDVQPQEDGLAVALAPESPSPDNVMVRPPPSFVAGTVGVGLLLVALAGLLLLRGRFRTPDMAAVEAAIEAGRYDRAARMANRILRKHPGQEDALLGRAIALSRAGQHAKVAGELSAHLQASNPTDGSLHYVLGLAYLELGKPHEGRAALQEAVRRTPSLAADVASRFGGDNRTSRSTPEGYA
jgi:hypothetical protein